MEDIKDPESISSLNECVAVVIPSIWMKHEDGWQLNWEAHKEMFETIVKTFHEKPMALCSFSACLAAKAYFVHNKKKVKITLGTPNTNHDDPTLGEREVAEQYAELEPKEMFEVCKDECNKIVSMGAFMHGHQFDKIQDGVDQLIWELRTLILNEMNNVTNGNTSAVNNGDIVDGVENDEETKIQELRRQLRVMNQDVKDRIVADIKAMECVQTLLDKLKE